MGYNVSLDRSTAVIKKENLQEAYKLMCDLNKDDSLKGGGSYGPGSKREYWFSWMDANYPDKCKTAEEVLEELGFGCNTDEEGNLLIEYYDNKTGQEDLFFKAMGHLVEGEMEWRGEDGAVWKWLFSGDGMNHKEGKITYD